MYYVPTCLQCLHGLMLLTAPVMKSWWPVTWIQIIGCNYNVRHFCLFHSYYCIISTICNHFLWVFYILYVGYNPWIGLEVFLVSMLNWKLCHWTNTVLFSSFNWVNIYLFHSYISRSLVPILRSSKKCMAGILKLRMSLSAAFQGSQLIYLKPIIGWVCDCASSFFSLVLMWNFGCLP